MKQILSISTKNALDSFFKTVADKPGDVFFEGGNIINPTKNIYTVEDLNELEKANRQFNTRGETVVLY